MPDVFTKTKRSEVMWRIRGRGNKETEVALMRLLRRHGITGWRRHAEVRVQKPEGRIHKGGAHGVSRTTFRLQPDPHP